MKTKKAFIIFPNQLFEATRKVVEREEHVYLIEDDIFFGQYPFHQKKLILHRASMKVYFQDYFLRNKQAHYLNHQDVPNMLALGKRLEKDKVQQVRYYDLVDDWLQRRLSKSLQSCKIKYKVLESPGFLCTNDICAKYLGAKKKYLLHHFYVAERKRLNLLIKNGEPAGGRWSLDQENRKKITKGEKIPPVSWPQKHPEIAKAQAYVQKSTLKITVSRRIFTIPLKDRML